MIMEKRKLLIGLATFLFVACSLLSVHAVRQRNSDLFFETMLEALVSNEYAGEPCYNAIQTGVSMWVIYCAECDRLTKGEPITWAGMGICE